EGADQLARLVSGARLPEQVPEDGEEEQPFQRGLVKLAGVTRRPEISEPVHHLGKAGRPGHVRLAAPQVGAEDMVEAAEEQPEGNAAGDIIVDPKPVEAMAPGHVEDAERHADHAAMEGHAAIPELRDFERVLQIISGPVEEDIAEPAAEDDPERGIE